MPKRKTKAATYVVGYGKPPASGRFRPGVSGNPKGRPRGSSNVQTLLRKAADEVVVVREGGRQRRISKLEAVAKQLVNKAAAGDLAATRLLLSLNGEEGTPAGTAASTPDELNAADAELARQVVERIRKYTSGGGSGPDGP